MEFDDFIKCLYYHVFIVDLKTLKTRDRTYGKSSGKLLSDTTVSCNGIDRLDSAFGYTLENCVPCCKYCNTAKNTMLVSDFLSWVSRVYGI